MDRVFLEGLAGLFGKEAKEVDVFFTQPENEGDEPQLKPTGEVVKAFGEWYKSRLDERYNAATRKANTQWERWIKDSGFDGDGQGKGLFDAYVESVKSKAAEEAAKGSGQGDKLTPEAVKAHDLYKAMVEKVTNLQGVVQEKEGLIDQERQKSENFIKSTIIRRMANGYLKEAKWAAPAEDWDFRLNMLLKDFDPARVKVDGVDTDSPKVILLDEHGEPKTDDFHRPIDFKNKILSLGKHMGGFHAADPGKGSPSPKGDKGGSGSGAFKVPENIGSMDGRQFTAYLKTVQDPKQKEKLREARIAHLDSK